MSGRLEGKGTLITGGGGSGPVVGIGQAISVAFAREGCRVAGADASSAAGTRTVEEIEKSGGHAILVTGDLTDPADCERVVEEAVDQLGPVSVLVNNLGVLPTTPTVDDWDRVMAVNVRSHMLMTQYSVARFSADGGSIVNLSSDSAISPPHHPSVPTPPTAPVTFLDAYTASKGAVLSLTRQLAVRYGPLRIRANSICPGGAWTGMAARFWTSKDVPEARLKEVREMRANATLLGTEGTAWDIANAALFLASDDARWITGQTLVVDGGAGFAKLPVDP